MPLASCQHLLAMKFAGAATTVFLLSQGSNLPALHATSDRRRRKLVVRPRLPINSPLASHCFAVQALLETPSPSLSSPHELKWMPSKRC